MASNTSTASERLLTVLEVAHALRVSEWTVRRYITAGRLPAVRVGACWRVARATVDLLIDVAATDMTARGTLTLNTEDSK